MTLQPSWWTDERKERVAQRDWYHKMAATCRICQRKSVVIVGMTGFCVNHRRDAVALQRYELSNKRGSFWREDSRLARREHGHDRRDAETKSASSGHGRTVEGKRY